MRRYNFTWNKSFVDESNEVLADFDLNIHENGCCVVLRELSQLILPISFTDIPLERLAQYTLKLRRRTTVLSVNSLHESAKAFYTIITDQSK